MSTTKVLLRMVAATVVIIQLGACSRTVQWEEEVALNAGPTIWVKRAVVYTRQGGAGNPFDVADRPSEYQLEFEWLGKHYLFRQGGVMVLAIAPTGTPVLVGRADAGGWDATHGYKCTIPFYVQFVPDASGRAWSWPDRIEPWLYGLPANLAVEIPKPGENVVRYTQQQKALQPYLADPQLSSAHRIEPRYGGDLCKEVQGKP